MVDGGWVLTITFFGGLASALADSAFTGDPFVFFSVGFI